MKRYIYAFYSVEPAHHTILNLRAAGIPEKQVSLIARADIEMDKVPDHLLDVPHDFVPAVGRGAAYGGITGLVAGLVAMAIPPLGIAVAGATLLGFFTGGALLGAWSASLVGASVPDEIRRKFEDEIKAGRVLLVIDSDGENDALIVTTLGTGAGRHLLWQSEIEMAVSK